MRVLKLLSENIKKIKVVEIVPGPEPVVQITGRNGQGKTSVLDSILYAIAGKDAIDAVPLRRGQSQGKIVIELGDRAGLPDWTITRTFSEREGTQLFLRNKAGNAIIRGGDRDKLGPQQTINTLFAKITMDPLAFVRLGATAEGRRRQAEQLRGMVELAVDLPKLEREQGVDYNRRRELKRELDRLEATLAGQEPIPEGVTEEPIDVGALARELQKAGEHNRRVEQSKAQRAAFARDAEDIQARIDRAQQQIAELERQIKELKAARDKDAVRHREVVAKAEGVRIEKPADVARISQAITDAERNNGWVRRRGERAKLERERDGQAGELAEIQARMEDRERQKERAFAEAKMPVDGLSFTEDGVYWEGLPLEQASGAEQLRVSMAVAMAANPAARVLRIVDGSLLDDESLKLVAEEARRRDFQVWIESVDTSGEVGFVLSEGELVSSPQSRGEAPKAPAAGVRQRKARR